MNRALEQPAPTAMPRFGWRHVEGTRHADLPFLGCWLDVPLAFPPLRLGLGETSRVRARIPRREATCNVRRYHGPGSDQQVASRKVRNQGHSSHRSALDGGRIS